MNKNLTCAAPFFVTLLIVIMLSMAVSNSTYGICENLRFTICGVDLWFQVHVVENAPFQVLMGRPFFVYTQCITQDYANGDQEITIECPNTNKSYKLPTRPRYKDLGKAKSNEPVFVESRQG